LPQLCHADLDVCRLKHEERINKFPQYRVPITLDDNRTLTIHYLALYSTRQDAPAVVMIHGWPGAFVEFLPIMELLSEKYTPQTLPFSLVVPSLPGYGYSSPPPLDSDFTLHEVAELFSKLMDGLGFKNGYLAQGGDLGHSISRLMAKYDGCRAVHNNMASTGPPKGWQGELTSEKDKRDEARRGAFHTTGMA
jgi:microsomal epoxide hydrolase